MVDKGRALCYPALELSHSSTEDNVVSEQPVIGIGGGLTHIGERLFGPVRRAIDQHAFPAQAQAVQVVRAGLSDNVGVLGAAAVAWCRLADQ